MYDPRTESWSAVILDWNADPDHAKLHEILDAETGEPLPMESPWSEIYYADDSRGLVRVHKLNKQGRPYLDPDNPKVAASEELRRAIRIVRKADLP